MKKLSLILFVFITIFTTIFVTSCNKKEDDPIPNTYP